ncbi:hypothetical protein EG864_14950, partial [Enterococcus faecalis]
AAATTTTIFAAGPGAAEGRARPGPGADETGAGGAREARGAPEAPVHTSAAAAAAVSAAPPGGAVVVARAEGPRRPTRALHPAALGPAVPVPVPRRRGAAAAAITAAAAPSAAMGERGRRGRGPGDPAALAAGATALAAAV